MKKNIKINPYRLVFQIAILSLISFMIIRLFADKNYTADFEAYCPFGGILAFTSFLVNNSLACSMTSVQIAMGAALILAIILFSKLFCSFICPVGTISEWIGNLGEKFKLRYTITGYGDILLRGLKYAILFITIYYTVTSSELFCKKFDPYYAAVTGFNTDVTLLWAIITISVVVLGSFFIRLFWCKYICPLGAVSNIFMFFFTFLGVTAVYIILLFAGIKISFIWPLALVCCIAYILEFFSLKSSNFPFFRITRHTDICTNCKLCSKTCPQDIDVASLKVVKHIDCHLCSDCIHVCPEDGALTINKNGKKWLPAIVIIIIVAAGIIAGRSFEIPTLSLYWGDSSKKEEMKTFTRSGLKSVKCFGSSTTFANQMKRVKGVTGVTTFVKTNTVQVMYDPAEIDTVAILKSVFTPVKVHIRKPGEEVGSLDIFMIRIDNFLDPLDAVYLKQLLSREKDIYGFTTEFDCPVRVNIFTGASAKIDLKKIKDIVETRELEQQLVNGKTLKTKLIFRVTQIEKEVNPVSTLTYLADMYYEYRKFYKEADIKSSSTYSVLFPGGGTESTNLMLDKISFHLSNQPGIIGIESVFSEGNPMLRVYFDKSLTNDKAIHEALNSAQILSPGPNGTMTNLANPLSFPFKGNTVLK
jgi:NAD-dependent dihydropyrimidine dehydrogenase PreA subunit